MRRLAVLLAALAVAGCGGPDAPAERAARLVPADALLYLHLSTDPEREEDERLLEILGAFPSARALAGRLGSAFDFERDVRPWLGPEAAVAFLDTGTPRADVLLIASVRDQPKAEGFLTRLAGGKPGLRHRGVVIRRYRNLTAGFVDGFLVAGQLEAVKKSVDAARGQGPRLGASPLYRRVTAGAPEGRSADAYVSAAGVRRLLRPQPGFGALLGGLLDHPWLRGVGASLSVEDEGLRARLRLARPPARQFEPELLDRVPRDAAVYLGMADAQPLEPVLADAAERVGIELDRRMLGSLREVTIFLRPDLPAPVVTLIARTTDERRTRDVLARLQQPLADALYGPGLLGSFQEREIEGVDAFVLPLSNSLQLSYAVFDGLLVVSTQPEGIAEVQGGNDPLADEEDFKATVGERPERTEALAFADLSELLALGEQTGLDAIPAFQAVQDDLRRIRAAGASVGREGQDTTAEIFVDIP